MRITLGRFQVGRVGTQLLFAVVGVALAASLAWWVNPAPRTADRSSARPPARAVRDLPPQPVLKGLRGSPTVPR